MESLRYKKDAGLLNDLIILKGKMHKHHTFKDCLDSRHWEVKEHDQLNLLMVINTNICTGVFIYPNQKTRIMSTLELLLTLK